MIKMKPMAEAFAGLDHPHALREPKTLIGLNQATSQATNRKFDCFDTLAFAGQG
jgi:hypothetical protein